MTINICALLVFICACLVHVSSQISDFSNYVSDKTSIAPECTTALEEFAGSASNFTLCTIMNSRPIHACKLCVEPYMEVLSAHNRILTSEVNGTKCKDMLINLDRLEIIESTFASIQDIWMRGFCDRCFDWSDGKPTLSNRTITFLSYLDIALNCINTHKVHQNNTDIICKDCMTRYITLNSYYESLKITSETVGICMDIVDSMNATRSIWSDTLNCCKLRKRPEIIFLCCTGIITALPALFYLFVRFYCDSVALPQPAIQNRMGESLRSQTGTSGEES